MKTSTLRKLPVPFVVACLLGIGVLTFLLLSSGQETKTTAQAVATPGQTSTRLPSDSSRYRVKSGVAKLNRSGGSSSRPSSQAGAKVEMQKALPTEKLASKPSEVRSDVKLQETPAATEQTKQQQLADRSSEGNRSTEATDTELTAPAKEDRVASTKPLRRDRDRVKSATVAAPTKPASNDAYSTENPDPSELLSQVLGSDTKAKAAPQLEINEPDTIMPPGFELKEDALTAPETSPAKMAKKTESRTQGSTSKSVVSERTEKSSVVNGELKLEADQPAPKRVVRIINPASNALPVWFVTQQHKIQLKPGQRYETSTDEELLVRFARGAELGVGKVSANDGDWVFSVTRQEGWKLTQN